MYRTSHINPDWMKNKSHIIVANNGTRSLISQAYFMHDENCIKIWRVRGQKGLTNIPFLLNVISIFMGFVDFRIVWASIPKCTQRFKFGFAFLAVTTLIVINFVQIVGNIGTVLNTLLIIIVYSSPLRRFYGVFIWYCYIEVNQQLRIVNHYKIKL